MLLWLINDGKLVDIPRTDRYAYWTKGAIISNLDDLRIWAEALEDGKLLSKQSHLEQMTFVDVPGGEAYSKKYGLGVANLKGWVGQALPGHGFPREVKRQNSPCLPFPPVNSVAPATVSPLAITSRPILNSSSMALSKSMSKPR